MIKDFLREIKYAYQRVKYGYDERIKWEFSSYFEQFLKPLEEFCLDELSDLRLMELNPKQKEIFTETVKKINCYRRMKPENYNREPNEQSKLWNYVGKNIRYFWN